MEQFTLNNILSIDAGTCFVHLSYCLQYIFSENKFLLYYIFFHVSYLFQYIFCGIRKIPPPYEFPSPQLVSLKKIPSGEFFPGKSPLTNCFVLPLFSELTLSSHPIYHCNINTGLIWESSLSGINTLRIISKGIKEIWNITWKITIG